VRELANHLSWTLAVLLLEAFERCDHWASRRHARSVRDWMRLASAPRLRS